MAIADSIGLEMARTAGQAPQLDVGTASIQGAQAGTAVNAALQGQNKEAAAQQFQQVLNEGYKGMVSTFSTLSPEEQQMVGDPSLYQRSEDTMASWWGLVAKAKVTSEKKTALASGTQKLIDKDVIGGNKDLMTSGNITAEQGVKAITAEQDRLKTEGQGKSIAELFKTNTQGQSKEIPGPAGTPIDGKSPLGRTLTITAKKLEPYAAHIDEAAKTTGLPPALIKAVITRESRGNAKAQPYDGSGKLRSSAKGLMQLIDSTAAEMGVTDPFDPKQNIEGGSKYLASLIQKYGDVSKGVAAYHEGPAALDRNIRLNGDKWRDFLSDDAKEYVPDVERYYSGYGGGNIISKESPAALSQTDMVMKLAEKDPELPNHPLAKVLLDAMDKDAKNAKGAKGSGTNINDIRERNLQRLNKEGLMKRVQLVKKDINPKLDMSDKYNDLDASTPGGLFGKGDIANAGIGSKLYRDWLMTDASGAFRTSLAALSNVALADASGKTVTKDEAARMEKELGLGPTDTVNTFRLAMQRKYNNTKKDFERDMKMDPEAALEMMTNNPELKNAFKLGAASGNQVTTKSGKKITVTRTVVGK